MKTIENVTGKKLSHSNSNIFPVSVRAIATTDSYRDHVIYEVTEYT